MGAALFAAVLSSCSKTEVVNSESLSKENYIGFSSYANINTKGTPVEGVDGFVDVHGVAGFGVSAFVSPAEGGSFDGAYLGDGAEGAKIIYGADWTYNSSADKQYWPNEALDFYAVAPHGTASSTTRNGGLAINDYVVTTNSASQTDLMYASAANVTYDGTANSLVSADGQLSLHFKHALSQIRFVGTVVNEKLVVEINSITLNNIASRGDFSLAKSSTTSNSQLVMGSWSNTDTPENYVTKQEKAVVMDGVTNAAVGGTAKLLSDNKNPLMLMPQYFTAWDRLNETISATSGAYITVNCSAYILDPIDVAAGEANPDRIYLIGSSSTYSNVYAPLTDGDDTVANNTLWHGGNRVTYHIAFDKGYDEEGNEELVYITFNATSDTNWIDESASIGL